ncbi:ABC transporter [Streptomyces mutabilis]|uniref:ABC transporter n=1 Tax=Streptomyces mutabilis TaxID=67332 RepID=UPI0022BA58EE|nr:ABC transporter [Streptomyces mutabilis]MCZ9349852.1 ABC transporter [Streptomyces mutabilis]
MRGVTRSLVVPVWRTLPWRALAAAGALGLLAAGFPALTGAEPAPWQTLVLLRGVALIGALGLAFLLDDPARHLTTPVPVRRPLRQALRVAMVAPLAALWWTAVLLVAPSASRPPAGDITLEAAVVGVLALAGAAAAVRLTDEARPGAAVVAALLLAAVLAPLLEPDGRALFVPPEDPRWPQAHDRWAALLVAVAVAWTVCGPEPVGRRRRRG